MKVPNIISYQCAAGLHAGRPGDCDGRAFDLTLAIGPQALAACICGRDLIKMRRGRFRSRCPSCGEPIMRGDDVERGPDEPLWKPTETPRPLPVERLVHGHDLVDRSDELLGDDGGLHQQPDGHGHHLRHHDEGGEA